LFQGSVVSALGNGINAVISAIAAVIETIIGAIVTVRLADIDVDKTYPSHFDLLPTGNRDNFGCDHGHSVLSLL